MDGPEALPPDTAAIPASLVAKFVYCPRLFYLEWVRGLWADNEFTVEGSDVHRRVDEPGGAAPLPGADVKTIVRGMELASEHLGVVAKLDLVEFTNAGARPVDYKRGRPAPTAESVREPTRVQLCLQAMLLEEAGYPVKEGVVYFAETNERVSVPITAELRAWALEVIAQARMVAARPHAPPPLVDSPKCSGCSLVGICMPDELNVLRHRRESRPRTLVARDSPSRPLYLAGNGVTLRKEANHFLVVPREGEPVRVRPIDVSHVVAFGIVPVTTPALHALLAQESPVVWLTRGGRFLGMTVGFPGKNIDLRKRQFTLPEELRLALAREFVVTKIRNQRTLLRRNARHGVPLALSQLAEAAQRAREAPNLETLRGIEGVAGRVYFQSFAAMLRPDLPLRSEDLFVGRNRRPPRDPVNAVLSFVYTLLVKDLAVQAYQVGFDPYEGVMHTSKFGRPALALDLAEEFRPLVADSVVLTLFNNGEVSSADFRRVGVAVVLNDVGRRKVLRAYERRLETEVRHPRFRYRVTYRRLLDLQTRLLAATLLGELDRYEGFETR